MAPRELEHGDDEPTVFLLQGCPCARNDVTACARRGNATHTRRGATVRHKWRSATRSGHKTAPRARQGNTARARRGKTTRNRSGTTARPQWRRTTRNRRSSAPRAGQGSTTPTSGGTTTRTRRGKTPVAGRPLIGPLEQMLHCETFHCRVVQRRGTGHGGKRAPERASAAVESVVQEAGALDDTRSASRDDFFSLQMMPYFIPREQRPGPITRRRVEKTCRCMVSLRTIPSCWIKTN